MKIFAATYTPMKEDLSVNPDIIPAYSEYLKGNKIHGIFTNGSTGDFTSLTLAERMAMLDKWVEHKGDLVLINHVGHLSLKAATELARHSQGKADAIAAIAPFYFKPSNLDQLIQYCAEIALSAPNIPFYYYHLPALTQVDFNMKEFLNLAVERIPNFGGIKFTQNDLVAFQETNDDCGKTDIYFGVDEAFLPSLAVGAKGWVGSTFNHLTPLYEAIADNFYDGNLPVARQLQSMVLKFVKTLGANGGFNGGGKSFMREFGIDCGPSRFPHRTLEKEETRLALNEFNNCGLSKYLSKS